MATMKTAAIAPAFPTVKVDVLPSGMGKVVGKPRERNNYDWGGKGVKEGITVPGDKYMSASSSAQTFAKTYPHDDKQAAAIARHIASKLAKAKAEAAD